MGDEEFIIHRALRAEQHGMYLDGTISGAGTRPKNPGSNLSPTLKLTQEGAERGRARWRAIWSVLRLKVRTAFSTSSSHFDYPVPEASVLSHTECGFRCRVKETQDFNLAAPTDDMPCC